MGRWEGGEGELEKVTEVGGGGGRERRGMQRGTRPEKERRLTGRGGETQVVSYQGD